MPSNAEQPAPDEDVQVGLELAAQELAFILFSEQSDQLNLPGLAGRSSAIQPGSPNGHSSGTTTEVEADRLDEALTAVAGPEPFAGPDIDWVSLDSDAAWESFSTDFVGYRRDNDRPWLRCLGVARGMGAVGVLIERYYVCLDHRSEHASFYAHIDQPRTSYAVRVHFFSVVAEPSLFDAEKLQESYLGYVVCRRGNLPIVGRALLRTPSYVTTAAEVTEPVHLLGQTLRVTGCPFMQQDARFANCAHVAAWTICYTAYRRGLMDRKVIADLVHPDGGARALRPHSPRGIYIEQMEDLLRGVGLRSVFPDSTSDPQSIPLPPLPLEGLPTEVGERLRALLGNDEDSSDISAAVADAWIRRDRETEVRLMSAQIEASVSQLVDDRVREALGVEKRLADPAALGEDEEPIVGRPNLEGEANQVAGAADRHILEERASAQLLALETFRSHLLRPYLTSRFPIYLDTPDHAMVLVGMGERADGDVRYFIHDDQFGPYLGANDLAMLARSDFEWQTTGTDHSGSRIPHDTLRTDEVETRIAAGVDRLRRVVAMVIPGPARAPLPIWSATAEAVGMYVTMSEFSGLSHQSSVIPEGALTRRVAQSLVMGIDYKADRRSVLSPSEVAANALFSAVNLAEWVVVVEGLGERGRVTWEAVYDASSSETAPRLQLFRFMRSVVLQEPREASIQMLQIESRDLPALTVHSRIGKISYD